MSMTSGKALHTIAAAVLCAVAASGCAISETAQPRTSADGANRPEREKARSVRVGTCNVRFKNAADDKAGNGWDDRKSDLADLIRRLDMDVFGMQEVVGVQCDDLRNALADWEFECDKGATNPVAYRKSRFRLVDKGVFWLSETPDVPRSLGWGASNVRCCRWLILEDVATGRKFCFVNTHLDHRIAKARLEGVRLILGRMKDFAGGLPVVFVGDFNCDYESPPSVEVRKAMLDAREVSEAKDPGPANTFHGWGAIKGVAHNRCDYIYVSEGTRVRGFRTHDDKRPGLDRWPTDHYLLTADVEPWACR